MTSPPPGAVVVGVDESPDPHETARTLEAAAAEAVSTHRPLHVVHVWATYPTGYAAGTYPHTAAELTDALREHAAGVLRRAVTRVREGHPSLAVTDELAEGDARHVLEERSHEAATLVVGARGRGAIERLLLGSTSAWLSRHARCPLLVVRPHLDGEKRRVLVGVDGGRASAHALDHAYEAASRRRAHLTVVHCYDAVPTHLHEPTPDVPPGEPEDVRRTLAESVAGLAEKYPDVEVTLEAAPAPAVEHLVAASDHVGLLVVGSHRRSRVGRLTHLSVSRAVVEHARCTVAVVPADA